MFTKPLGFVGVIVVSLLGGIFPILLLVSSRMKGEIIPGFTLRILSLPVVTACIYLIFLANLIIHGVLIWRNSIPGSVALGVGIAMIALTTLVNHKGAFSPRLLLELRSDRSENEKVCYSITSAGTPALANILLRYPESEESVQSSQGNIFGTSILHSAVFQIPASHAWDLKVLSYQLGSGDLFESMPGRLEIQIKDRTERYDLRQTDGEALTILHGEACKIVFSFVHKQGELIHANL